MSVEATITGWRTNSSTARIRVGDQTIDLASASDPNNFPTLADATELHLYISTGNVVRSICDVQDATFAFLGHLGTGHHLRTLDVHIDVSMPDDDNGMYAIVTSNAAERMFQQEIMREFRGIEPGELSRPHMTAFLTDPIRTVCDLRDGKKKGKFTLKYTGETGNPWKEIKTAVRDLVLSDQPMPIYQIFAAYFVHLRALLKAMSWLARTRSPKAWQNIEQLSHNLARCRIRANLQGFHANHAASVKAVEAPIPQLLDFSNAVHYEPLQMREWKMREVLYLLPELEAALPDKSADVSFFGYNEIDAKLREWKNGSGDRKAAAKRKRADKEQGGGKTKKGGRGGGGGGARGPIGSSVW
ncbi:hypothetical protein LTR85_009555 [Meristemomyces frigidus]|nr:hypothetical protein LTR85_009555 [Meristemomyces frigidus]